MHYHQRLENRFLKVIVKEYTNDDLIAIGKAKHIPDDSIIKLVDDFMSAKHYAKKNQLKPAPTARDYINTLSLFSPAHSKSQVGLCGSKRSLVIPQTRDGGFAGEEEKGEAVSKKNKV